MIIHSFEFIRSVDISEGLCDAQCVLFLMLHDRGLRAG